MGLRGYTYNWTSAESDVQMATPLTLPPWVGLNMRRCSCRLVASDSVYRVVLDPPDYSKFIRLLLCEPPEPDTLNGTINRVVKPMRHLQKRSFSSIAECIQTKV